MRKSHNPAAAFARESGGGSTLESAIAICLLVTGFAALIEIANAGYAADRMERAARAAARAVALLPAAPENAAAVDAAACRAIRRELDLSAEGGCGGDWTVTVEAYENPEALLAGTARGENAAPGGEDGDMVTVRIAWSGGAAFSWLERAEDGDDRDVSVVATGLARNERAG